MEEIYRDRKKFSEVVFEVATSDLVNMGITVVSYTLKDIQDEDGYLKALGLVRTAEVKKDARIGEAEARRDDDDDDDDNDNDKDYVNDDILRWGTCVGSGAIS